MGTDEFTPVGGAVAGPHNGVREDVSPAVTTRYRWHYAGDADTRPSYSGVATVRVRTPQHPPNADPRPRSPSARPATWWVSTAPTW